MLATLLLPLALIALPQDRPTATELVDQARTYLPAYEGEHRAFLTAKQQPEVQAASHILSAALTLEPESTYALWWKGHAEVLLGEDRYNRDLREAGKANYQIAMRCFDQAVEKQPDYLWAWYARAMAHQRLLTPDLAIMDFEKCIGLASQTIKANADESAVSEARFIKYKARLWLADCRMRMFLFEEARKEYRAFYADNGNNPWDLGIKLAESYQRERDFVSAIATYESLLEVPQYAAFDGAYNSLGYLEGLLENPNKAAQRLNEALQRERRPTLYPRLWLWILAPDDQKAEALEQLNRFITHPPGDLSPWDLQLGRFMAGDGTAQDFMAAANQEVERRKTEAVALDDLMCEAWFYSGLHLEQKGSKDEAVEAYKKALAFRPAAFKWEWAYARLRFALLVREPAVHPSGTENNSPPRTHVFHVPGKTSVGGAIYYFDHGDYDFQEWILGELRESGPRGDVILRITDIGHPGIFSAPQMEVIGVP
ncbi:MAG: tetratricopeptide (TPR) repeat protein [Glaciecola sp.]|jgi:tetratricopeptide (TPR) repeat protein